MIYSREKQVLLLRVCLAVVPVELVEAARKRGDDEEEDEQKLADVHQHTAQGDLQRAEVLVRLENTVVCDLIITD